LHPYSTVEIPGPSLLGRGTVSHSCGSQQKENAMLTTLATLGSLALAQTFVLPNLVWIAIVFFIIAIVAYVLGARGVAGMSAGIGRTLLFVFLILAILFVIVGLVNHAA
jgi:uncharacterized membrane protein YtjA (UPF0391 family)